MTDHFLRGKLVNLRTPDLPDDVTTGGWYRWFNDPRITEYLEHGVRPVSAGEEIRILEEAMKSASNLILAVVCASTDRLLGTISLKGINYVQRRAEIAIVMSGERAPGAALEAMALLTRHAFDRMNLQKLIAGQHEALWKWVNTLAMIGYRVEGYRSDYGYRNGRPYGVLLTGITAPEFHALQAARGGDILLGDAAALGRSRSPVNPVPEIRRMLATLPQQQL